MRLPLRLMCLTLAALAPPIALLAYNAWEARNERVRAIESEALVAARALASDLSNLSNGVRGLLAAVAAVPSVQHSDQEACSNYLARVQASFDDAMVLGVSDARGDVRCLSVTAPGGVMPNNAGRAYRNAAIERNEFAIGDFAIGTSSGVPALHFAYPVRDAAGHPSGVAFAAIRLDWLGRHIARLTMPPNATVTVTDGHGTILVRLPESDIVGQRIAERGLALLPVRAAGTFTAAGRFDGEPRIAGYAPVEAGQGNLVAWVSLAPAEALLPVVLATQRTALVTVLSIVIALALAAGVGRYGIQRPLARLDRAARRWSHGDLSARAGLSGRHDEFARLGEAFDAMARTLQQREAERDEAEHALRISRDEAMKASAAKTSFLAAASHDLRQPLQAMTMAASLLALRHPDDQDTATIARLRRSVSGLANLLDSLLDVSQMDAGLVRPRVGDVALRPLLESVAEEFADAARAKGLALEVCAPSRAVRTDPALLGRMIRNLVSNAIKYTDQGRVDLRCTERDGSIEIEVADTGIGIPATDQQAVFEDFRQLHNPERDRSKGLGLGLAIVQRTGALLGHPVRLSSLPGVGSSFTVTVPCGADAADAPAREGPQRFDGDVLLVEDDALVLESTATMLAALGLRVHACGSAEEARARIAQPDCACDLVLADYRLPGASGLDVVRAARQRWPNVRVAIVTGDVGEPRLRALLEPDVTVVAKPLRSEQLLALLAPLACATLDAAPAGGG